MIDYNNVPYTIMLVLDYEEGGYTVNYPELQGCVTCGDTVEEALQNALDAKREWIKACIEEGIDIPLPENFAVK